MSRHRLSGLLVLVLLLMGTAAEAQGILDGKMDRTKDSAERKARDRVNQYIDQMVDKGVHKTEGAVQCVATDQECLKSAKEQGSRCRSSTHWPHPIP